MSLRRIDSGRSKVEFELTNKRIIESANCLPKGGRELPNLRIKNVIETGYFTTVYRAKFDADVHGRQEKAICAFRIFDLERRCGLGDQLENNDTAESMVLDLYILHYLPHENFLTVMTSTTTLPSLSDAIGIATEVCLSICRFIEEVQRHSAPRGKNPGVHSCVTPCILSLASREFVSNLCAYVMHHSIIALDYLHSNRIVHRDVRPASMLLNTQGCFKLSGFSKAKYCRRNPGLRQGVKLDRFSLAHAGMYVLFGTTRFLDVTGSADVYDVMETSKCNFFEALRTRNQVEYRDLTARMSANEMSFFTAAFSNKERLAIRCLLHCRLARLSQTQLESTRNDILRTMAKYSCRPAGLYEDHTLLTKIKRCFISLHSARGDANDSVEDEVASTPDSSTGCSEPSLMVLLSNQVIGFRLTVVVNTRPDSNPIVLSRFVDPNVEINFYSFLHLLIYDTGKGKLFSFDVLPLRRYINEVFNKLYRILTLRISSGPEDLLESVVGCRTEQVFLMQQSLTHERFATIKVRVCRLGAGADDSLSGPIDYMAESLDMSRFNESEPFEDEDTTLDTTPITVS